MEDSRIIDLYWARNEQAIAETDTKYGRYCQSIAFRLLAVSEDADECVNDTWLAAWNCMPPQRPDVLRSWLGRIVRNLAVTRWRHNHAARRYSGLEELLDELSECVPSPVNVEKELEDRELAAFLDQWVKALPKENRVLFVRRYWYGETVQDLAAELGVSQGSLAQRFFRMRNALRQALEKEGYAI